MVAPLDDAALAQDQDLVGVDNGRKPVGDDQGGPVPPDPAQGLLDGRLGRTVEGLWRDSRADEAS